MSKQIENIYILSVITALGLLFFANAENIEDPNGVTVNIGIGKSFYIPCAIALACSIFIKRPKDKLNSALILLIIFALIASIVHFPTTDNILGWTVTRFVFAILCFRDLRMINPRKFVKYITYISPIIIAAHYLLSNPLGYGFHRYAGFYGDSNYLALALNFLITICYLSFRVVGHKALRVCAIFSIIGAIPLILVSVSRGGIIGLCLILVCVFIDIYKKNRKLFLIIVILCILFSSAFMIMFGKTLYFIQGRFDDDSDLSGNGARSRILGIKSCINVLYHRPKLIFFGNGLGNTLKSIPINKNYGYLIDYTIHNSFFLLLFEMGIFAFVTYLYLFYNTFKHLKNKRFYLLICLLIADIISLASLPGMIFMPGWILLFFLANHNIGLLLTQERNKHGNI